MRVVSKSVQPIRAPKVVMRHLERILKERKMSIGVFILDAVMRRLGFPEDDIRLALTVAYPPRVYFGGPEPKVKEK